MRGGEGRDNRDYTSFCVESGRLRLTDNYDELVALVVHGRREDTHCIMRRERDWKIGPGGGEKERVFIICVVRGRQITPVPPAK